MAAAGPSKIATAVSSGLPIALRDDRGLTAVAILRLTATIDSQMSRSCLRREAPKLAEIRNLRPLVAIGGRISGRKNADSDAGVSAFRRSVLDKSDNPPPRGPKNSKVSLAAPHAGPKGRLCRAGARSARTRQDRDSCEVRAVAATKIATDVSSGLPIAPRDNRGLTGVAILRITTTVSSHMSRS